MNFGKLIDSIQAANTHLQQNAVKAVNINLTSPELSRCRQFYISYSDFLGSLTQKFNNLLSEKILGTLSQNLIQINESQILGSLTQESEIVIRQSVTPELQNIDNLKDVNYFTNAFMKIS